ncbi:MAG: tryptophan synthase subunit alpha [Bacillota bacterium]
MKRIKERFEELQQEGGTALMPYLTAGDPNLEVTKRLIKEFESAGADMIELGVPYSDPLADGPTIQAATQRALANQVSLSDIFSLVAEVRSEVKLPIILMGYYNSFYQYGLKEAVAKSEEVGVDGIIIPDLPPEEAEEIKQFKSKNSVANIFLVSQTSSSERIELVDSVSEGFIYTVAALGVTGARSDLSANLQDYLATVREHSNLPLAVGFGISTPKQAAQVAQHAAGVIVGSAIIKRIEANLDLLEAGAEEGFQQVSSFVSELKAVL